MTTPTASVYTNPASADLNAAASALGATYYETHAAALIAARAMSPDEAPFMPDECERGVIVLGPRYDLAEGYWIACGQKGFYVLDGHTGARFDTLDEALAWHDRYRSDRC